MSFFFFSIFDAGSENQETKLWFCFNQKCLSLFWETLRFFPQSHLEFKPFPQPKCEEHEVPSTKKPLLRKTQVSQTIKNPFLSLKEATFLRGWGWDFSYCWKNFCNIEVFLCSGCDGTGGSSVPELRVFIRRKRVKKTVEVIAKEVKEESSGKKVMVFLNLYYFWIEMVVTYI